MIPHVECHVNCHLVYCKVNFFFFFLSQERAKLQKLSITGKIPVRVLINSLVTHIISVRANTVSEHSMT